MSAIKKGDVVRVKSGGPRMTVDRIGKNISGKPAVWCLWIEGAQHYYGTFDPDALEITPAEFGHSVRASPPRGST